MGAFAFLSTVTGFASLTLLYTLTLLFRELCKPSITESNTQRKTLNNLPFVKLLRLAGEFSEALKCGLRKFPSFLWRI